MTQDDPDFQIRPVIEMDLGTDPPCWPRRPDTLAETLAIAGRIGERFATTPGGYHAPGFVPAHAMTDADHLRGIADRGRDIGTEEDRVATVLYFQSYVYRVAAPMLAAWVLHGRVPDVSAENLALSWGEVGRPEAIALKAPRVYALPGDTISDAEVIEVPDLTAAAIDVLLDRHLLPMMRRLRETHRLGLPIVKGTVASQIGMALTFIDAHSTVPWQVVSRIALQFFERTFDTIAGQGRSGDMAYKCLGAREGVTFRRGTCCLAYRVPGKDLCGGCPLRPEHELLDTWRRRLLARPSTGLVGSHPSESGI